LRQYFQGRCSASLAGAATTALLCGGCRWAAGTRAGSRHAALAVGPCGPLPQEKLARKLPAGVTPLAIVAPGSFSPPTLLHLRIFEEARDRLERTTGPGGARYVVVGGYLSPVHAAYGKESLAPAVDRLAMARLAVADSDWLMADGWECMCQDGWTRTALVLERFATELRRVEVAVGDAPARPGLVRTAMLCGGDVLESFAAVRPDGELLWSDADLEVILGRNGVVCIERDGADLANFIENHPVLRKRSANITLVRPRVHTGISSSVVRRHLAAKESIRYLVPEAVRAYIYEKRLHELPNWS